jgi:hypothetical protein
MQNNNGVKKEKQHFRKLKPFLKKFTGICVSL